MSIDVTVIRAKAEKSATGLPPKALASGVQAGVSVGHRDLIALLDRLERAETAVAAIREAVSRHPECDRYEEGDVISCGWKSAFRDVARTVPHLE